jgi:hypothetical protein
MQRRTPVLALAAALAATALGVVPAQAAAPDVTSITSSHPTLYPNINNATRFGATAIAINSSDLSQIASLEVQNASHAAVRTFEIGGTIPSVSWNGRDAGGTVVPTGTYSLVAYNGSHEAAPVTGSVNVSRQKLVRKALTVVMKPTRKIVKLVGRCSTLRSPSKRGWKGSYGYYANTRCKTQTWKASYVITGHALKVPAAERYDDLRIDTYGGAAKAKPRSRAFIDYYSTTGASNPWVATKASASKVGWHNGRTAAATHLVDSHRYVSWRFYTAYKAQYDLAKFRVTLH